jgi:hypothetical protein
MVSKSSSRQLALKAFPKAMRGAMLVATLFSVAFLSFGQPTQPAPQPPRRQPAPIERRSPDAQPPHLAAPANSYPVFRAPSNPASTPGLVPRNTPSQQHLGEWIESHRNLSLSQQQHALDNEPGFRQLKPQVQQRMHDRLMQLNNMPPDQQQRVLARTEAMERLAPAQRQQIRGAMQQLGSLPEDRRRAVARTFRSLRDIPVSERQNYLNSPQYRGQFTDTERNTLNNLLNVAPMLPPAPTQR